MKPILLLAGAAAIALCACTKKEEEEEQAETAAPEETKILALGEEEAVSAEEESSAEDLFNTVSELADEDAPEADGTERFYGKRAFTIVSTQTGAEEGDVTEHVRDWGRKRAEIKDTSMSIAGFTQETKQRLIYDGDQIITIDETTGNVTTSVNPFYDAIVSRMKNKSGVEYGKEIMAQFGGRETGEKGKFAGHECDYWEVASAGTKSCVTSWGATLHSSTNMGGVTMEKTAVEVRMDDGGPDSAFEYDASKAQEAPDISKIMQQMKQPD